MPIRVQIFDRDTQKLLDVHEVRMPSVKIGRGELCDVQLDAPDVSMEHLVVRRERAGMILEAVGRNGVEVGKRHLVQGQSVAIDSDTQIRVSRFSLFVDADKVTDEGPVETPAERLAQLELDLHTRLLDHINGPEERLRSELDRLVRERIPDLATTAVPPDVIELALRESFYGEITQSLFLADDDAPRASRARGFVGEVDASLRKVIHTFRLYIGVSGVRDAIRKDLEKVAERFPVVFQQFMQTAAEELKVLFVRRYLVREIMNLVRGYGPLQDLLELPDVNDIMVVHKDLIYVERGGRIERLHRTFIKDEILQNVIQRIVAPLNRRIDQSQPLVDARLKDGSRVNAIIPPLAVKGACLTIRKFSRVPLTGEDLIRWGSITRAALRFLEACVRARKNMLISGGTGSGKTSLLNILSGYIPDDERIVTIEDAAELQLRQMHVVTLETRPSSVEGTGSFTIRDLVRNSLRMRPDRVIVGECRGGEAYDMLQAMNTGHDGSLTTVHANSPEDALLRLESMVIEAVDLPVRAVRDQIEAALSLIVQTRRLPGGKRMVTHITEVVGVDPVDGRILTNDVFELRGQELCFSGYLPSFLPELVRKKTLTATALFEQPTAPSRKSESP